MLLDHGELGLDPSRLADAGGLRQPILGPDQVGRDLAGRMGGSDSCCVPIRRGREERSEPGCTPFKKPSAIHGTIEPLGMIGVSVTMMKRDQVARSGRHDPRARVAELADAQDLGSCPARGEGSNPSSRTSPSEAVRLRQNHASYKGKPSPTPVDPIPSSRQYPKESGSIRPLTATRNATRLLPDDPGLAAVADAWPDLPEALKACILAMVRAVPGKNDTSGYGSTADCHE